MGGTVFLGPAVVGEAQALGADVTIFSRGRSGPAPAGVTHVRGDRTGRRRPGAAGRAPLRRRRRHLRLRAGRRGRSAAAARPELRALRLRLLDQRLPGLARAGRLPRRRRPPRRPRRHRGDVPAELDRRPALRLAQGRLRAGGPARVRPGRTASLRGGCIVGPHDGRSGRLPWWIDRVARGGEVLVPGRPDDPVAPDRLPRPGPVRADRRRPAVRSRRAAPRHPGRPAWRLRARPPARTPGSPTSTTTGWPRRASRPGPRCRCGLPAATGPSVFAHDTDGRRSGRAELAAAGRDRRRHLGLAAGACPAVGARPSARPGWPRTARPSCSRPGTPLTESLSS